MASITYVATCELENISLTLPPATLRNAAPLHPQINRKIRYTAVDTHHVNHTKTKGPDSQQSPRSQRNTRTYVRCERDGEHAHEEQGKRDAIDDIAPVDF